MRTRLLKRYIIKVQRKLVTIIENDKNGYISFYKSRWLKTTLGPVESKICTSVWYAWSRGFKSGDRKSHSASPSRPFEPLRAHFQKK